MRPHFVRMYVTISLSKVSASDNDEGQEGSNTMITVRTFHAALSKIDFFFSLSVGRHETQKLTAAITI